ncbi:MAG: ATPase, T2SS/T4P/T4SS family, partial [Bacilli bacterium]
MRKRVGDLLLESGLISNEQLAAALQDQKQVKGRLGDVLIQKGYITEQQLIEVLEFQMGIPRVHLYNLKLDSTIVNIITERMAIDYQVIPIRKEGNKLILAMSDPLDYFAIDNLRMSTGFHIEPVIASKKELQRVIQRHYGLQESVDQIMQVLPKNEDVMEARVNDQDAPVIKMVNQILKSAVQQGVSDIHFDPQEDGIRVRFRIDGHLRLEQTLPKHMQGIVISRLKIMAELN